MISIMALVLYMYLRCLQHRMHFSLKQGPKFDSASIICCDLQIPHLCLFSPIHMELENFCTIWFLFVCGTTENLWTTKFCSGPPSCSTWWSAWTTKLPNPICSTGEEMHAEPRKYQIPTADSKILLLGLRRVCVPLLSL